MLLYSPEDIRVTGASRI